MEYTGAECRRNLDRVVFEVSGSRLELAVLVWAGLQRVLWSVAGLFYRMFSGNVGSAGARIRTA